MRVCITEKPSVAKDIAAILGASVKRDGYFEGDGVCVTWTFGHLCCLKEPNDYTDLWKRWSLGQLPMIPQRFGIKLIHEKGIEHQFGVIKRLISNADEVINCGDAGQEGELIQRWVMQKAGIKCPVKRLWISSLTDESIRQGFGDLRPEHDYDTLYKAGLSRAIGDWLLGMNATRLYTLKYGSGPGHVLSIGRVQTPTLALIVDRYKQITEFVPEDYWELKTVYRGVTFNATSGRFKKQEEAQDALNIIRDNELYITDITTKRGHESAPRLFDLTSLQVECNKLWGWTADDTLRQIQSLYEKKVTTYPRVDTTYLTTDIYRKVPEILRKMTPYSSIIEPVLARPISKSKKIFDDSKVTDHHAIIPTGERPSRLVGDERLLYHLIARRFIAVFYPDCVFNATTVMANVGDISFKATGKVIVEPGWRTIYANDREKEPTETENDTDTNVLPKFSVGEHGTHEPALLKKTTQPPKPYTEGTLLRAMESAGKTVDDEELREAMKDNGIGRPSTRSAIIETLFKRRYIRRERKNIHPTQAGIELIGIIREEMLKSAKLTGLWENKLRRIERGTFTAEEFISELKQMVSDIVLTVLADNSSRRIINEPEKSVKKSVKTKSDKPKAVRKRTSKAPEPTDFNDIICPKCGKGHLIKGRTAVGCDRFRDGCDFVIPFDKLGDPTPASVSKYLKRISKTRTD